MSSHSLDGLLNRYPEWPEKCLLKYLTHLAFLVEVIIDLSFSFCPVLFFKNIIFVQHSHILVKQNPVKESNSRNSKGSGCQKGNQVITDRNRNISIVKILVYQKNESRPYDSPDKKIYNHRRRLSFHLPVSPSRFLLPLYEALSLFMPDVTRPCPKGPASRRGHGGRPPGVSGKKRTLHILQGPPFAVYSLKDTSLPVRWYWWYLTPAQSNICLEASTESVSAYLSLS